jgi:CheY-like chemotaxis protein/anti-sigma regulatory factor (Ser/Thr protein kinase)
VNLVNNAVHAIGEAEGTISITLEADAIEAPRVGAAGRLGFARIQVSDTGCGMDDLTRVRIFDPFFTTKPPGKGTGLGLAVVHGIVQGCGGRVEVESAVRRGSTFTLSLPLTAKDEAVKTPVREPVQSGDGEHILYVDDDEAVVFLIEHWLRRQGYRVSCYTDAQKALDVFSGNPEAFDVVITDLSMPGMNGFDFARGVKAVRPNVPVVMTSGFVREEDERRAEAIGIARTILKPNTIDELGVTLHELFAQLAPVRRAVQGK